MDETPEWMRVAPQEPLDLQTDRPHAARIYDYLLGGKTHYAADREQAEKFVAALPSVGVTARVNRSFMHRSARVLANEYGLRQFLDIGTGIPTSPNLHEVAQSVAPECRVVYVDNDPIVLAHSRALHTSSPEGATAYVQADATEPEGILASPLLQETLDLGEPVAITLVTVLHWLPEDCDQYAVVRTLLDAVPPGSALAITYFTGDFEAEEVTRLKNSLKGSGSTVRPRPRAEVERFFDGLELLEPGLVPPQDWRPDPVDVGDQSRESLRGRIPLWAGVGVKTGSRRT